MCEQGGEKGRVETWAHCTKATETALLLPSGLGALLMPLLT